LEGNTEKTVTKREIKEGFKHLVFDTCVLFTFFVWTVHRSWFLFEHMARNLGLVEATEKETVTHSAPEVFSRLKRLKTSGQVFPSNSGFHYNLTMD